MSKELDDIFESEEPKKVPVKLRVQTGRPQAIEDIFGSVPQSQPREFSKEEIAKSRKSIEPIGSFLGGAASGATMGYSDRLLPEGAKKIVEGSPISRGAGYLAGSLIPGAAISKGLGALSKIPGLASLASSGIRQGMASGAIEGVLSDPGDGGSRITRGIGGAAMGGSLGGIGGAASKLGEQYDIYGKLQKSGFADEVRGEIEGALSKLMNKAVTPRKKELNNILSESDKTISINPEYLKGFKRDAILGKDRKKGGLDKLAEILAKRSVDGQAQLNPKQAQRLKQYFDSVSGYKKQKPYGKDVNPKEIGAYTMASKFRKDLADVDPRVGQLNEKMSDALGLRDTIRSRADTSPISTITKDPITNPDRAQEILDLDALAGSELAKRGKMISKAQDMKSGDTAFSRSGILRDIFKGSQRGIGALASNASKVPQGTKESILAKILDSAKRPYSEEE